MALFNRNQIVRVSVGFGESFIARVVRTEMISVLVEWQHESGTTHRTWVGQAICSPVRGLVRDAG